MANPDMPLLESRVVMLYRLARIRRDLDDTLKMVAALPWPEDTPRPMEQPHHPAVL